MKGNGSKMTRVASRRLSADPDHQHGAETDDEFPASTKVRDYVRGPLAECAPILPGRFDFAAHRFIAREALHHLPFEVGQFALLPRQQLLDIARPIVGEVLTADEIVVAEIGMLGGDRPPERRPDHAECDRLVRLLATDRTGGLRRAPRRLGGFCGLHIIGHGQASTRPGRNRERVCAGAAKFPITAALC